MQRREGGIHELFIPGLKEGELYKYEIKLKGDTVVLKSDPYGTLMQKRPDNASVIYNICRKHQWQDEVWMKQRKKDSTKEKPEFIYEHSSGRIYAPGCCDRNG